MALIPTPLNTQKPLAGYPGLPQNMEECNSFTAFAEAGFGYGVPMMAGADPMGVVELATANRFIGISLANIYTSGAPVGGNEQYGVGDKLGVADEGVVWVMAGGTIVKGQNVFFNKTNKKYYGASATGYLPLPNCEFDGDAAADTVVALRVRVVPGGANVTAAA